MSNLFSENQLIIIGNGFDLECGLKSSYSDFFQFLLSRKNNNSVDKNVWDYIFFFLNDEKIQGQFYDWKDIEAVIKDWAIALLDALQTPLNVHQLKDIQSIVGRILSFDRNIELFINEHTFHTPYPKPYIQTVLQQKAYMDPRLSTLGNTLIYLLDHYRHLFDFLRCIYFKRVQRPVDDFLFDELKKFESEFTEYMCMAMENNTGYQLKASNLYKKISREFNQSDSNADYILSFNYTKPSIADNEHGPCCWRNVHGNIVDKNIIFGFDIEDLQHEQRKDRKNLRFTKTYRVFQLPQELDSKGVLEPLTNNESFSTIKVYGHSLNRADYSYFKAIFDCVDLYSSNITLRFLYPSNQPDLGPSLHKAASDLLTDYGDEMPDKGKGHNLMHKLLLQNRLSVTELDTSLIGQIG